MSMALSDRIFSLGPNDLESVALELFHYQYQENALYQAYVNALKISPATIRSLSKIPFLPIQFFKSHTVVCGAFEPELIFESSGTTQTINSRHMLIDGYIFLL
jgi:hypothetical protein